MALDCFQFQQVSSSVVPNSPSSASIDMDTLEVLQGDLKVIFCLNLAAKTLIDFVM